MVDTAVKKPYLTKLWWGRWWVYVDTNRKYKYRTAKFIFFWGIVSYRKIEER